MQSQDQAIDNLLEILYSWSPYSPSFKIEISKLMAPQEVRPKQLLYQHGSHVSSAWFSCNCWAAQYKKFSSGIEVVQLFGPGEIFTDLNSFFLGREATSKIIILEGNSLLQITKSNFIKLKVYPETAELLQHYMLLQSGHDFWRMDLLALSDQQKIKHFAARYPINRLPAHVAASYLRMDPSRFSILRGNFNKSS